MVNTLSIPHQFHRQNIPRKLVLLVVLQGGLRHEGHKNRVREGVRILYVKTAHQYGLDECYSSKVQDGGIYGVVDPYHVGGATRSHGHEDNDGQIGLLHDAMNPYRVDDAVHNRGSGMIGEASTI